MKDRSPVFIPNLITLLRVLIGLLIPFLLLWPTALVPGAGGWRLGTVFGLFLFGAFTDFWDGWFARRYGSETPLGRFLDPTADKIFILSAMASFVRLGIYSHWYLVPIFAREIAVTFCRMGWMRQGRAVGAEKAGKLKLVLQVVSAGCSFLYLFSPTAVMAGWNYSFLILAVLMTLISGVLFFYHNRALMNGQAFFKWTAAMGVGTFRPMPGTYGSLLGLLFVLLIAHDAWLHAGVFFTFLALAYGVIPRLGLEEHEDPPEVVIDEVLGMILSFWMVPLTGWSLLAGFLLFRAFDVVKVFPLNWLEKRKGANGILWDDLGAGVYTWLILKIFFR